MNKPNSVIPNQNTDSSHVAVGAGFALSARSQRQEVASKPALVVRNGSARRLHAWRERVGMTQRQAAEALGMALNNYQRLERGRDWNTDRETAIDRRTELACIAIERGLRHSRLPESEEGLGCLSNEGGHFFRIECVDAGGTGAGKTSPT